ncbi:hypothetical protein GCM10008164_58110 [Achromobacter xylosoxidans]|nr:hypothetical protein GCM10008164_58110 [Achromobacter xylosoxidans]
MARVRTGSGFCEAWCRDEGHAPVGQQSSLNADAGWVVRVRVCMRKRLSVARHPSPPTPQELGTNSKSLVVFAQANTIEIQKPRMSFSAARAAENDGQRKNRP